MPTFNLNNARQTKQFGEWLATKLAPGSVVSLEGPLGAGKTTLVQGLAGAFGIKKITSPTFILFRQYAFTTDKLLIGSLSSKKDGGKSASRKKEDKELDSRARWFVHADMYRVKNSREVLAAGLGEYLGDPATILVIEWGDLIKKILPAGTIRLKISIAKKGRKIWYPASLGEPKLK